MFRIKNLLAAVLFAAGAPAMAVPPEPTSDRRLMVAFIGDSITDGVISDSAIPPSTPNEDKLCWQDRCFVSVAGLALDHFNIDWANRGYGGATSRDWDPNDRLENDIHFLFSPNGEGLLKETPAANLVVLYIGTNDAIAFFENAPPTSGDHYEKHIEDTIRTLHRRGIKRFIVVTPPLPIGWENTVMGDLMTEYAYRARRVARRHPRVRLVDAAADFPDDGWEGNAIHPNIRGHEFLAEAVLEGILRTLRPRGWHRALRTP